MPLFSTRPVQTLLASSGGKQHRPLRLTLAPKGPAGAPKPKPTFTLYVTQCVQRNDTELTATSQLLLGLAHSRTAAAAGIHSVTINAKWPCMESPDVWPHLPAGLRTCLPGVEAEAVPVLHFLRGGFPVDDRPAPGGLIYGYLNKLGGGDSLFGRKSWKVGAGGTAVLAAREARWGQAVVSMLRRTTGTGNCSKPHIAAWLAWCNVLTVGSAARNASPPRHPAPGRLGCPYPAGQPWWDFALAARAARAASWSAPVVCTASARCERMC